MKKTFLLLSTLLLLLSSAFSQDRIYWGDQNGPSNNDKIGSVNATDLGSATTAYTEFALNPNGIAYYHANPTYPLFYAANRLYRNDLAGNSNEIIVPTGQFTRGLAIDYIGKKIYWANQGEGTIGRADLDGGNQDEGFITGLSNPWDLEIDPVNQKIYWSETDYPNENAFIQRANLSDGGSIETLVSNVNSQGIAVDPLRGKIYYTVFASGTPVYSANLDGSGVAGPISGLSANADIDVDVRTGVLYMIDYSAGLITKANSDGSSKSFVSASGTFIAYADVTAPSVLSIERHRPSTVNVGEGGTAGFQVTFSEPVLGLDAADFELTGTPTGAISVTATSLQTVFEVEISNLTGTGTLDLNVAPTHDIIDFGGNLFGGTITAEETYNVMSIPAPVITSVSPGFGPEETTVTITGANFSTTPAENTVTFNGVAAAVSASTATTLTVTVPAGATTGPVAVSVYGLTAVSAGNFTICTPPPVPTISREGNVLTSSADDGNQWLKDGVEIEGATNKTLAVTDPADYTLRVTGNVCSSLSDPVTVTEVELTPAISGFTPESGPRGETVIISGTNFSPTPGDNAVTFGGTTATVTASTLTSITTTVPAEASLGAAAIAVTVNGRTASATTDFTVLCTPPAKPTITSEGGLLTSSSDANNQWLKNGAEIPGATNKSYTATEAGSYSVKVTVEGCSSESDPTAIVGAEEMFSSAVSVYPNPSHTYVRIELPSVVNDAKAELYTTMGVKKESVLLSAKEGRSRGEINVEEYPDGMYIILITAGRRVVAKNFQKHDQDSSD